MNPCICAYVCVYISLIQLCVVPVASGLCPLSCLPIPVRPKKGKRQSLLNSNLFLTMVTIGRAIVPIKTCLFLTMVTQEGRPLPNTNIFLTMATIERQPLPNTNIKHRTLHKSSLEGRMSAATDFKSLFHLILLSYYAQLQIEEQGQLIVNLERSLQESQVGSLEIFKS